MPRTGETLADKVARVERTRETLAARAVDVVKRMIDFGCDPSSLRDTVVAAMMRGGFRKESAAEVGALLLAAVNYEGAVEDAAKTTIAKREEREAKFAAAKADLPGYSDLKDTDPDGDFVR